MKNILLLLFSLFALNIQAQTCNENTHSANINDSWLSCEKSLAPNTERGICHWVMYDLGYSYYLQETTFWNYNVSGQKNKGFKEVIIDYSLDGIIWQKGAEFILPKASGTNNYTGFVGPSLGGNVARYILISAKKTYGNGNCGGLSEFKVNVSEYDLPSYSSNFEINSMSIEKDFNFNIFPNPSSDVINVDFEELSVTEIIIQNSSGHELKRMSTNDNFESIDISTFPNGIYFLNLISDQNEVITKRFVKVY